MTAADSSKRSSRPAAAGREAPCISGAEVCFVGCWSCCTSALPYTFFNVPACVKVRVCGAFIKRRLAAKQTAWVTALVQNNTAHPPSAPADQYEKQRRGKTQCLHWNSTWHSDLNFQHTSCHRSLSRLRSAGRCSSEPVTQSPRGRPFTVYECVQLLPGCLKDVLWHTSY